MGQMLPHASISRASRRRLARCLVGSPIREVERDLVLETLANTCGNRTESARLLGVSLSPAGEKGPVISMPPTFNPLGLGRIRLAWWMIAVDNHST